MDIEAKFWVKSYYSATLTDDAYVNESSCSDRGANLGVIVKPVVPETISVDTNTDGIPSKETVGVD